MSEIALGVLFSRTGSYSVISEECFSGAVTAINEVNDSGLFDFRFRVVEADPNCRTELYAELARDMMGKQGCQHIIGCVTSWSRKELLPVMERYQGLLWYTIPYEGFESHDRVIYSGACPNQNVVPLFERIVPQYGNRAFLVGSNYIWGWEMNRIARELLAPDDGQVLGERYVPLGDQEIEHLIAEIKATRPDFIFNNLIGDSSYAFLNALHKLRCEDADFGFDRMPVLSCNLTETELPIIGSAAEGVISTASYFETACFHENEEYVSRMHHSRGEETGVSAMFTSPYQAVWALARAVEAAGTSDPDVVRAILPTRPWQTPAGGLDIDESTQHATLTPYIGQVAFAESFDKPKAYFKILNSGVRQLPPDPYLVNLDQGCASISQDQKDEIFAQMNNRPPRYLRVVK